MWRGMSLVVVAVSCFGLFLRLSNYQQSERNARLVLAIREGKTEEALAALKEGANPNARGYLVKPPGEGGEMSISTSQNGVHYNVTLQDVTPNRASFQP